MKLSMLSIMKSQRFVFILLFSSLLRTSCFVSSQSLCMDRERDSLLKFKESFSIAEYVSGMPDARPKTRSWRGGDCCSWDGVECDNVTGHVIGLDMRSSFLYGSIDSNNSLFDLVHLRSLSLSDNHFNYSQIPSSFKHLSKLTHLDLFACVFSGQIPPEISQLSKLSYLDLSLNLDPFDRKKLLELETPDFKSLIRNLTRLEDLNLNYVDISSAVPDSLANLSSLRLLYLDDCGLKGTEFSGSIPSSLGKLGQLEFLDLSHNSFTGQIPSSFTNLTQLQFLALEDNDFSNGSLSWVVNLTKLIFLDLANSSLIGPVPPLLSNLARLKIISLKDNDLSGKVDFDIFLSLLNLTVLDLSGNRLEVVHKPCTNRTLPQFTHLILSSCHLKTFPAFLRYQRKMEWLDLSRNEIGDRIPKWMLNVSVETLCLLLLQFNLLTGFEKTPIPLPWLRLQVLFLGGNMLNCTMPIPPPSTFLFDVSSNKLRGQVPSAICGARSLRVLGFSRNELDGNLPQCLGNFSDSLSFLDLSGNHFVGEIPSTFAQGNQLRSIDFSDNQFEGKLPRSLANCRMLESLIVRNNRMDDIFPFWLGSLPELRFLVLRNNSFHGNIGHPSTEVEFPNLRIIDVSFNRFTGELPSTYVQSWKAMKNSSTRISQYMKSTTSGKNQAGSAFYTYDYWVTITIKGFRRIYFSVLDVLVTIDFSNNKFEGQIPEAFGKLRGLISLDLSDNNLTGVIPSSLAELSEIESLDLSGNKLSGEIPQELTGLTFLGYFNVSHNELTGRIPQEHQLGTFDSSAYEGNAGLCGIPLPNKCVDSAGPPLQPSSASEPEDESFIGFGWKVVAIGYACGFVAGIFLGKIVTSIRPRWFARTFRVRISRM